MDIQVRRVGDVAVLDLKGRLVLGEERKLTDAAVELLSSGSVQLAVNLAEVPMMDSSGIGALVKLHSSAMRAGGKCRFFAANETLLHTLRMVRLDSLLGLCADEAAALAPFQA